VTFYVALEQLSNYAINNIGAYIDNGGIDIASDTGCAQPQSLITPQILDSNVINDTVNWKMIQGLIKANGTEKFITIGNFSDKNHTTAIPLSYSSSNFSWYLVDDVSVIESNTDANAGNDTTIGYGDTAHIGIYEGGMPCTWYIEGNNTPIGYGGGLLVNPIATTTYIVKMELFQHVTTDSVTVTVGPEGVSSLLPSTKDSLLYPNPAHNVLIIERAEGCEVKIFNFLGQQVEETIAVNNKSQRENIEGLINGVYLVQVFDPKTGIKVVKQLVKE
jgi:hypothetical protein